jgi:anti-anti-sigma factor
VRQCAGLPRLDLAKDAVKPQLDVTLNVGDGFAVVALAGELDLATVDEPRRVLLQAIGDHKPDLVVIDCADLRFLDSSGLGAFVAAHKRLAAVGSQLALANLGTSVGKPVQLTGLYKTLHVHWIEGQPVRPWAQAGATADRVARHIGLDMLAVPTIRRAPESDVTASMGTG